MTWYAMQMMTWTYATRKQMTRQQQRITGRHLAHRSRGVTLRKTILIFSLLLQLYQMGHKQASSRPLKFPCILVDNERSMNVGFLYVAHGMTHVYCVQTSDVLPWFLYVCFNGSFLVLHTSLFVVACVVQNLDMLVFISCNCDAFSTICCNERGIVAYIELFAMWSHLRRSIFVWLFTRVGIHVMCEKKCMQTFMWGWSKGPNLELKIDLTLGWLKFFRSSRLMFLVAFPPFP